MSREILEIFRKFLLLIFLIFTVQSAFAVEYPDFVGYVSDYAHLLSAPQASQLDQELRDFDNRTTIEVAVVTVNSIGGETPQNYAVNLANYWGIGKRGKDNGILFLVAMDSHDIWIEVGPGLAGQFTNSQVQQIVDDVIIPRFRAGLPDQGVIDGTHAIIEHFDSLGPTPAATTVPPTTSPTTYPSTYPQDQDIGNPNFIWTAATWAAAGLIIVIPGAFLAIWIPRRSQAKKNLEQINDFRKALDGMVDRETSALVALKELQANYVPSIWNGVEEGFNSVDQDRLELEWLRAQRASNKGWIAAPSAQSLIGDWQKSYEIALKNVNAPVEKLEETKKAQREYAAGLAGLDAAFMQAHHEITGSQISMATMMELEKAKQLHSEAQTLADQPANIVDWIVLRDRIHMAEEAVEQVSKDAVRDKAIAEKIQGQDPDEMLAEMKQTLDDAEETLGNSYAAKSDLDAGRADYERAREYQSERMNTIDLYLLMMSVNRNVEHGHQHYQKEMEKEMKLARQRVAEQSRQNATAVHHTGFGSSGSRSFGGGRMGGGSHGGGKW